MAFDRKKYMKLWRKRNTSHVKKYNKMNNKRQREKKPLYPCACGCDKKIRTGEYSKGHSSNNVFKTKNPAPKTRNKGKGWIMSQGYKALRRNDRNTLEHRYLMEKHLNRKLESSEYLHHKNGNKQDNRIENLEIMDAGTHFSHHVGGHISKEERELVLNRLRRGFTLRGSIKGTSVKSLMTPSRWRRLYV